MVDHLCYNSGLCFEMDKNYLETKLQLLLSPAVLVAKDTFLVIRLMIYISQRLYLRLIWTKLVVHKLYTETATFLNKTNLF
jgi:hypothetical protein